jgi:hypothetical protein
VNAEGIFTGCWAVISAQLPLRKIDPLAAFTLCNSKRFF